MVLVGEDTRAAGLVEPPVAPRSPIARIRASDATTNGVLGLDPLYASTAATHPAGPYPPRGVAARSP